jgi:hypothetical protein
MSSREGTPDGPFVGTLPAVSVLPRINLYHLLLAATLVAGVVLRFRGFLGDFPLFDGGMFYVMIGDIQANGYRLPEFTSYNGGEIPFNYPPLAFYLAAAIDDAGFSRTGVMIALPALASAATVGAMYLLAEPFLKSKWAALVATFAFAMMPETFSWMIVGGGLTRAMGFLFAVLALSQLYRMYTRPNRLYIATSAACVALTVLTHLEMTLFLALSAAVMFAFYGLNPSGIKRTAVVALAALVITAPWWLTLLSREGLDPWLNTGSSRGILGEAALRTLTRLNLTGQFFIDVLGLLALLGVIISVIRREFFLPCWLLAIALLMPWVFTRMASVPAALLIGYVLTAHLWPWMREGLPGMQLRAPPPAWLAPAFGAVFVLSSLMSGIHANRNVLVSLPDETREVMAWAGANTAPTDSFVVITGRAWYHDHAAEWFPALAGRVSVATIQGTEWLGGFGDQVERHDDLQRCIDKEAACLGSWESIEQTGFNYVYVSRETPPELRDGDRDECCATLRQSLTLSEDYRLVFQNAVATIFERITDAPQEVRAGN